MIGACNTEHNGITCITYELNGYVILYTDFFSVTSRMLPWRKIKILNSEVLNWIELNWSHSTSKCRKKRCYPWKTLKVNGWIRKLYQTDLPTNRIARERKMLSCGMHVVPGGCQSIQAKTGLSSTNVVTYDIGEGRMKNARKNRWVRYILYILSVSTGMKSIDWVIDRLINSCHLPNTINLYKTAPDNHTMLPSLQLGVFPYHKLACINNVTCRPLVRLHLGQYGSFRIYCHFFIPFGSHVVFDNE